LPLAQATALAQLDGDLYAAGYDPASGTSVVYRVRATAQPVFTVAGKVLSMLGYNGGLFIGLDVGMIQEILGSGVFYPPVGHPPLAPVTRLKTDGALMYAAAGEVYVTYNGSTWQENGV
jgi:hypothetical protein